MAELEQVFAAPVIESYGMTEAAHQITSNPMPPRPRKAGSVGIPAGPEVAILDAEGGRVALGGLGEVAVRGDNVMKGYEYNPVANQHALTNGWLRTGDQGRFDVDGYLFLTGRIKEIINRGGEKVSPTEVDATLLEHPGIAQAVTFAVPHPTLGEDIAAAVVLKENETANERDIRAFVATRLTDYKVPSQVLFLEEIPKGPTGKTQRIGLAEKLAEKLRNGYVAPSGATEEQLTEIWKELLGHDRVGVRDNFFALGGDSLGLASMLIAVEERFHREISIERFLTSPTVESIAGYLLGKHEAPSGTALAGPPAIIPKSAVKDTLFGGLKNRFLHLLALYAPGYKTSRVWLHRMRGVTIGENVSIGIFALIETAYPSLVSIGNNVSIGMRVTVIAHLRDLTVQARISDQPTVKIEDNVYIGPGAIILPNVTIGFGSVVSAGSVVTRSVPPKTLVQGNPAVAVARCGVSLGGGVSYEQFLKHLSPIEGGHAT